MGVGNISSKNITNRIVFETEAVTPSIVYTIGDPWSVRDVRIVNCHSAILSRSIAYTFELPFPHIVRIEILPSVEKIETATEPAFQEHFVSAMAFPHESDPFPALARHVDLPERTDPPSGPGRAGRRRRARSKRKA